MFSDCDLNLHFPLFSLLFMTPFSRGRCCSFHLPVCVCVSEFVCVLWRSACFPSFRRRV